MPNKKIYTAAALIIGNEVLSGRTADANLNYMASRLTELGIRLMEARVIPDVMDTIVDAVKHCRANFDYLFTTGGIGPTHDDITAEAIARAFGVPIERNQEVVSILESYIPAGNLNEARLKMADFPKGSELLFNEVSRAPGFRMGNVYVMAGVPSIMRSMFDGFADTLAGGDRMLSVTVAAELPEGAVASGLSDIQDRHPEVEIGSYPSYNEGKFKTSLVSRGTDPAELAATVEDIRALIRSHGAEPIEEV